MGSVCQGAVMKKQNFSAQFNPALSFSSLVQSSQQTAVTYAIWQIIPYPHLLFCGKFHQWQLQQDDLPAGHFPTMLPTMLKQSYPSFDSRAQRLGFPINVFHVDLNACQCFSFLPKNSITACCSVLLFTSDMPPCKVQHSATQNRMRAGYYASRIYDMERCCSIYAIFNAVTILHHTQA